MIAVHLSKYDYKSKPKQNPRKHKKGLNRSVNFHYVQSNYKIKRKQLYKFYETVEKFSTIFSLELLLHGAFKHQIGKISLGLKTVEKLFIQLCMRVFIYYIIKLEEKG